MHKYIYSHMYNFPSSTSNPSSKYLCYYLCSEEGLKGKLKLYLEKISLDLEEEKELGMQLG